MGVMGKFRDSTGIILWILIGSFGLLWVVMDVFDPNSLMMGPRSLGSVNGESISFDEYNSRVQYYTNAYSQQTGSSMNAETRALYEAQVWEELVSSKLLEQKMDELGITVTDSELLDMVYGDNPDPLIRQYFQREDGTIDPFVIQNVLTSGEYTQEAIAIELQLRQKRRQEKLRNFITAGLQVTDKEVEDEYKRRNTFADISYVRFPYSDVNANDINITDADIEAYFNAHKEQYKREESYRAKYVAFSTLPTSADTAAINAEVVDLREDFAAAEDDSLFLLQWQSTTPYNGVFVDKDDLREDYTPVLDVPVGSVTDMINLGGSVAVIKKVEERGNEIKFAVLSKVYEALPSTVDEAAESADEFQYFATEESSFEEEAERAGLTAGEISATKGTTFISGLGSSQQALDFMSRADEGDVSDPIELGSRFVVIKLEERTEEGYRPVSEVQAQIRVQVENEKRKQIIADRVSAQLAANASLEALASATDKEVNTASAVAASGTTIPGAGREPNIIGSIFGMSQGQTSTVLKGNNGAYVIRVENITAPNISTLDAASASTIRQELEQQESSRYLTVWLDELKKEAEITDNRARLVQ